MIAVTKADRARLNNVGLLKYKRPGVDPNFCVVNKKHCSRDKTTFVCEDFEILAFLEKYDTLNLQKIYPNQLRQLLDGGQITEDQVQRPDEYKKNAIVFVAKDGTIRCKKITSIMFTLGIWKNNKKS